MYSNYIYKDKIIQTFEYKAIIKYQYNFKIISMFFFKGLIDKYRLRILIK